jgi:putative endonuclease
MQSKGYEAEYQAEIFLQQRKLKLLERNYRCRYGEIDLIMKEGSTLVFVEVRMRTSNYFGGAAASITTAKQAKLIRAAQHYLSRHNCDLPCRFDAILISGSKKDSIEWIQNAFDES